MLPRTQCSKLAALQTVRALRIRARQRSREGVVLRNGCPKMVLLESPFLLCPIKVGS